MVRWLYTITHIKGRKWSIVAVPQDKLETIGWKNVDDLVIHRVKADSEEEATRLLLAKIDPYYGREEQHDDDPF